MFFRRIVFSGKNLLIMGIIIFLFGKLWSYRINSNYFAVRKKFDAELYHLSGKNFRHNHAAFWMLFLSKSGFASHLALIKTLQNTAGLKDKLFFVADIDADTTVSLKSLIKSIEQRQNTKFIDADKILTMTRTESFRIIKEFNITDVPFLLIVNNKGYVVKRIGNSDMHLFSEEK